MKLTEDTTIRFVVIIDEQVAGPYTLEGLHSLVYLGRITAGTLISREDEDAFLPISATVLSPELFPLLQSSAPAGQWTPPGQTARVDRKHYSFGEAKFKKVNDTRARRSRIEVKEILDEVRQAEIEAGFDLPTRHRFKISRRSIDFWIMLIAGNVVLIGGGILMQNTSSIVFGFAGSGLYTFGLLWSMYGVMDRY